MILILILVAIVIVWMLLYAVFMADAALGGSDFVSGGQTADLVVKIIKQQHLENGVFYDLGSCRGSFAAKIARTLPTLQVKGYDNDWFRILCAKTISMFLKNIAFKKQNIFTQNISAADIVYLYLPQEMMPDLQNKLKKELKSGALVISTSVSFPSWQPSRVYDLNQKGLKVSKLFIYKQV